MPKMTCVRWFCAKPVRRSLLLAAWFVFECMLAIPLRALGCWRREFDQRDLEDKAIQSYLKARGIPPKEQKQETQRMRQLLGNHSSHRQSLQKVLPGLWAWYPMGRLVYATTLVNNLRNKIALLDFVDTGGANGKSEKDTREDGEYSNKVSRRDLGDQITIDSDKDLVSVPLPPTMWVVGLPRTGSTFFHQLLNLDPGTRCLRQWELRCPVAISPDVRCGNVADERLVQARTGDKMFKLVFSELDGIHFVTSGQVDECVQGFVDAAVPEYFLWGCRDMPEAFDWYINHDAPCHRDQYINYRRLIAAILLAGLPRSLGGGGTGAEGTYGGDMSEKIKSQSPPGSVSVVAASPTSQNNGGSNAKSPFFPVRADGNVFQSVALKSPHHSVKLKTIADVFGGFGREKRNSCDLTKTVFVWLHRSLEAVVGSTCSMNAAVNSAMTSLYEETPEALGKRTLRCLARSMEIAVKQRREIEVLEEGSKDKSVLFIDVFHEDLRKDPVGTVERVYREAGLKVSKTFREALMQRASVEKAKFEARQGQKKTFGKAPRHKYSLGQYGLKKKDLEEAFANYREMVKSLKDARQ